MSQSGIAASQITVVSPEINPGNPGTPGIITPPAPTDTPESPTQPDKKETKDMDYLQFTSGRTLTIKAPEGIGDCSITWKSLNEDIVEVNDKGQVKAKKAGIAIVEAFCEFSYLKF